MKELLPDNIALLKNTECLQLPNQLLPAPGTRPKLREVKSLLTWVSCFATYIAIMSESHPHMVRSLPVYLCLIVREAQKCGGDGWTIYDQVFRQNAQGEATVEWSRLDSSLHSSTFLAFQSGIGSFCPLCFDSNHSQFDCALSPVAPAGQSVPFPNRRTWTQGARKPWEERPGSSPLCISWNRGRCYKAPEPCNFRHVCAVCGDKSHPARECRLASADSFFTRAMPKSAKVPRSSPIQKKTRLYKHVTGL